MLTYELDNAKTKLKQVALERERLNESLQHITQAKTTQEQSFSQERQQYERQIQDLRVKQREPESSK